MNTAIVYCNKKSISSNYFFIQVEKDDGKGSLQKTKIIVVWNDILNRINEKGLCKKHDIKVKNTPGVTNETVLDEIDTLVGQKPDCIIVHADTNDIKRINILNTTKKIERKVKILYPEQDWHSPAKYCEKTKKKKKNYLKKSI